MDVTLPADLRKRVEQELAGASGRYRGPDELIEQAVMSECWFPTRNDGHTAHCSHPS